MQVMTKRRSLNRIAPHLLALVVFVYLIAPQLTIGQSETLTLTEIRVDDQVLDLGPNLCFDFNGNVGLENQNNSFSVTLKSITDGSPALIDDDHLIWSISGSSFCVQFKPVGFDLNQFQHISVDTSVTTNLPNPLNAVLNNAPTFSDDSVSRSVEENSAPNSTFSSAVAATDINGDLLTYSLAGTDQEFFDIDSSTGVLKVGENTILDYETRSTYEVIVQVTDSKANITGTADNSIDDTVAVTINLIDVDELTITDASASEGNKITFTVTLDNAVAGGFKVTPGFTDGTTTKGADYAENTNAITFTGTAGETKTFTVSTTEDSEVEPAETFTVGLTVSDNTAQVTATDTATGTINDDDIALVRVDSAAADEGAKITFTVTLDNAVKGGFKVTPGFTDVSTTKDTDYAENTDAITFAGTAGETQTFTVDTTEDTELEPAETFTVGLTVSDTSLAVLDFDTATGTINDDDSAAVTIADAAASEGDGITFTVTLDNAVKGGFKVTPGFTDVTATKGTDYTANTAEITFAGTAGETKTFTVNTTEEQALEADETFTVSLAVSGTALTVTSTDTATGTINDDDANNMPTFVDGETTTRVVAHNTAAGENVGAPVVASDPESDTLTYSLSGDDAASFTIDSGTGQIMVAEGTTIDYDTTKSYSVTVQVTDSKNINGNPDSSIDDMINVTISVSASEVLAGLTISASHDSLTEGDSDIELTLTVTLRGGYTAPEDGLRIDLSTCFWSSCTATDSDYSVTGDTHIIILEDADSGTKTLTVSATDDSIVEEDETIFFEASAQRLHVATVEFTLKDNDTGEVTIANAAATEGDQISFTVTLSQAVSGGFKVTPGFTDGSAANNSDYTANTDAITFAGTAGETQTFTVDTTEDTELEPDETFTVSLTVKDTTAQVTSTDTATGTINDDDSAAVTIDDAAATEGAKISFTVTLDNAVKGGFKVTPGFTDVSATKDTDYTANTDVITFDGTAGETQTFTVDTKQDTGVEPAETFTVSLAVSATSLTVTSTDTATGTINDDDSTAVTIENAAATEGDQISFTVTLSQAVSGGFKVTPGFTDGSAANNSDYTANTDAITFAGTAGETQTFTVDTTEDTELEPDETFTVSLTVKDTTAQVTSTDTATGTINDDDSAAVTIDDAAATEGAKISFTVTLDNAVKGGFKVTPGFTDVSATKDTDYTANTDVITFDGTAGETQTFTVDTKQDTGVEPAETFTVSLAVSATSLTVTSTDTATGTINDDDSTAVTIENAAATEGDQISFTVTLSQAVSGGFKVTPGFTDGSAANNSDYTANTDAITFAGTAGETQTFTVDTTEDTELEPDETFTVSLTVKDTTAQVTSTDTATGTINDDDSAAVTIDDAAATEGAKISFTVTLDNAVKGGFKVTPGFTDVSATKDTDYTANTDVITFDGTAGETQTFTVDTKQDTGVEPAETFTVSLAVSATSLTVTSTDTATGTINDDDSTAVTIENAAATEGDQISFTVTLSQAVSGGFKVTPGFTDGSAANNSDYTANTDAITFAGTAGETQTFTVDTTEDTELEPDETFTVSLTVKDTTAQVTSTDTATGTINDDDSAAVTIDDAAATEGAKISFTVTLDNAVKGGFKVTPGFTDVSATKDTDYTANTDVITFDGTAGETQTFTVDTKQDTGVEPAETFTVSLAVSATSLTVTSTDTATGTINDDDSTAVTIENAAATEGDQISFTVTLSQAVSGGFKVTPGFTDGSAANNSDYTANTDAITFAGTAGETQTFTVDTTEDTELEPDETFTVSLTVKDTTAQVTSTDTATGTINDDDSAAVTIDDAAATEGAKISFTVTLDNAVKGGFKVTPGFTDVSATKDTDYTANTDVITFDGTAGETQTFTVDTKQDTGVEPAETFTVSLAVSATSLTVTSTDTATGTINDDDSTAVTIENAAATEGDQISFTVTLSQAVSGGFKVTPGFTDGSAANNSDYTANTDAITFAGTAGETQTFTVDTTEDTELEPDETFTVSLTVKDTTAQVTSTDTATGTINDDDSAAVTIDDAAATEGAKISFTVTLDNAVKGGFKVTPGFTDVSATKDTDYTANTDVITFDGTAGETQTFTVDTKQDTGVEPAETFTVSLAVSATSLTVTSTDTATGTINDDDSKVPKTPTSVVTLILTPSSISENGGVSTVTAKLSQPFSAKITIEVTAMAIKPAKSRDFNFSSNKTLTIAAGKTNSKGSVTITAVDNTTVAPDKMVTVSATNLNPKTITAPLGVKLTITEDDTRQYLDDESLKRKGILTHILATVGSQTMESTLDHIDSRFADVIPPPSNLTLAGRNVPLNQPEGIELSQLNNKSWGMSTVEASSRPEVGNHSTNSHTKITPSELLGSSSFSFKLGQALKSDPVHWSLWGGGDLGKFKSRISPDTQYSGEIQSGRIGMDARANQWVAGVALSREKSESDYEFDEEGISKRGRVETGLNSLYSYGRWTFTEGPEFRMVLGLAQGKINHSIGNQARETSRLDMRMASAGFRHTLKSVNGFKLTAKNNISFARLRTGSGIQIIDNLQIDTWRLRSSLNASRRFAINESSELTPFVKAAVRRDGGDGLTGVGWEFGGGVRYSSRRFHLEARGQLLAAHSASGSHKQERLSVTATIDPKADGLGLSLLLALSRNSQLDTIDMLEREDLLYPLIGDSSVNLDKLKGRVGYGFALSDPNGLLTPFVEAEISDDDNLRRRLGFHFRAAQTNLTIEFFHERHESTTASVENKIRFNLVMRF